VLIKITIQQTRATPFPQRKKREAVSTKYNLKIHIIITEKILVKNTKNIRDFSI